MRGKPTNRGAPGRVLWSTKEIAEVLGWNTHRVRRWLMRERAATKHGRHYYTSKAQLRRVFREAADEVISSLPEQELLR
jgi:hypothetical protein